MKDSKTTRNHKGLALKISWEDLEKILSIPRVHRAEVINDREFLVLYVEDDEQYVPTLGEIPQRNLSYFTDKFDEILDPWLARSRKEKQDE
jgi:hypothetical protein